MRLSPLLFFAVAALDLFATGSAAIKTVDSLASLQSAIKQADGGDTLVVKNGTYTTNQPITVERAGTNGQPLVITAETVGGVEITGTHGFKITGGASRVVIAGFKFTHAAGTALIDEGTSQVRFTRNLFLCRGEGVDLSLSGDDAQIDYNEFGAKKTAGNMLAVAGTGSQVARRLWIHHNYFHDLANGGNEGAQMLRLGLMNTQGQSVGHALVEYNLFAGSRGVTELISSRSSGNTYRYNTFSDSPTSQLTLRQGNDCLVYGNYFRNTEGVRIYGNRHRVFSNYFEDNSIAVAIGNGAPDPANGTVNKNKAPDGCLIVFNTFIDNTSAYRMSHRTPEALGATNIVFSNNLIQGGTVAAKISGPYSGAAWSGNLIWNVENIGDVPPAGYEEIDPLLAADAAGIKHLQAGSPAIARATGSFPGIAFDMDGQPRSEKKSVGADEISTAPMTVHLLSPPEVGPNAPNETSPGRASNGLTAPVEPAANENLAAKPATTPKLAFAAPAAFAGSS